MDEIKRQRGRPKKVKSIKVQTCPEDKEFNPETNRCRKIKEPKEPKKRGRKPKSKDEVPKEHKERKTLPKIKNSAVVPPAPSIPLSILSPSIIQAPQAPMPSETPPPILPLNTSSNYKKRIEKRKYNKPIKVIKQKELSILPLPNPSILDREQKIKKGKEIFNKKKMEKELKSNIPQSFISLPSLDINEMLKINPKQSKEFVKLQNRIKDSSSRKRNMLDNMYMGNEIKSANAIQKVFRGHKVRKDIVIV